MIHHSRGLEGHCKDPDFVKALGRDPLGVSTTPRLRALIDYSTKLTKTPEQVKRADVTSLLEVGFSEQAVVGIIQIVGFFNWVNRSVAGLGVELEERWPESTRAANPHPVD